MPCLLACCTGRHLRNNNRGIFKMGKLPERRHPVHPPCCSAPTIQSFANVTAQSARAKVLKPVDGIRWEYYNLAVCEQGDNSICLPGSPFKCNLDSTSADNTTICPITGAQANTNYTVVATAYLFLNEANGPVGSAPSTEQRLETPRHP